MIKAFEYILIGMLAIMGILLFTKFRPVANTLSYVIYPLLIIFCVIKFYTDYRKSGKITITKTSLLIMLILAMVTIFILAFKK